MSLYIYKDLRLKILGLVSHMTIITRMALGKIKSGKICC